MIRNYLKIAWRNVITSKIFSLINLMGLALGMTCCLFIFFWVKDEKIFTPPLIEGCVAGVMRKKILELATLNPDYMLHETVLSQEILLQADEVFLTNAIAGIRWVKECGNKVYKNTISSKIFTALA